MYQLFQLPKLFRYPATRVKMHSAPPFTPAASSSSSSSQSVNYLPFLSAEPHTYTYNQMPTYDSFPSATSGSRDGEEELDADGVGEDILDDEEKETRSESRESPGENKDLVERRKPRITLARGGACVICR